MVIKWEQFCFGSIQICKPFPVHKLEVGFKRGSQVHYVSYDGIAIETEVNGSVICINAYLGTDNTRKIIDEYQKQCRTQDRTLGDTHIYVKVSRSKPFKKTFISYLHVNELSKTTVENRNWFNNKCITF